MPEISVSQSIINDHFRVMRAVTETIWSRWYGMTRFALTIAHQVTLSEGLSYRWMYI